MANSREIIQELKIEYLRAARCFKSNNLKSSLFICDNLTSRLSSPATGANLDDDTSIEVNELKQLVWFLKIRCLADDHYLNESLLLNEDDFEEEEQVRVFSGSKRTNRTRSTSRGASTDLSGGTTGRATAISRNDSIGNRARTGILMGRRSSVASRHNSRASSSYRPLTTSLTASQTAFSRSTRPLLKYSTSDHLAKPVYEYLYSAQAVTSRCPDYRQCLEYLNLVQSKLNKVRGTRSSNKQSHQEDENKLLIKIADDGEILKLLGVYWLVAFGICYYNLHMNKQAEEYFLAGSVADPKCLDCYTWLVKIYLRTDQIVKVLKTCEAGLTHCKSPILHNWMARAQSLVGDLYGANLSLKQSLEYHPTNIEALANVGHFAFYSDRLDHSLRCFERIQQLTANQRIGTDNSVECSAQLANNLALVNFYNGFHHRVMPLFMKALLNSPDKEVTSDIWFNISFVPMSFGFKNLTVACLRLALKNNSQNEEATNNLGVINYSPLVNNYLHLRNRQELWGSSTAKSSSLSASGNQDLKNYEDQEKFREMYDQAELQFGSQQSKETLGYGDSEENANSQRLASDRQPEMLFNMAMVKKSRGEYLAASGYCNQYLEKDPDNYSMKSLLREIRDLVSHDS